MDFLWQVIFRSFLAVLIGVIIGSERARHGRAAGARTHILVALGAALTAMISMFVQEKLGYSGDILRLSAQVISGVGFLGAGVIILKNNNLITGLTTAAGVWTTSVIGIALGCGFYLGAGVVTALYMLAIVFLGKFERGKKNGEVVYVEIDDMYKANEIVDKLAAESGVKFSYNFLPPKSGRDGNLGISFFVKGKKPFDPSVWQACPHVVFYEEE